MRVVVAVVVADRSWRIHVDLADGATDLFRGTEYVGCAIYVPGGTWRCVEPDCAEARLALAGALTELAPFDAVIDQRRPRD